MDYTEFDFKRGRTILECHFPEIWTEMRSILQTFEFPLGRGIEPSVSSLLIDAFVQRGWMKAVPIATDERRFKHGIIKGKIASEAPLNGRRKRYDDYLKFQLGYRLGNIEVGVEIVYDDAMTGDRFHNVPKIGQVHNDLTAYRRVLTCPMWVVGFRQADSKKAAQLEDIV